MCAVLWASKCGVQEASRTWKSRGVGGTDGVEIRGFVDGIGWDNEHEALRASGKKSVRVLIIAKSVVGDVVCRVGGTGGKDFNT